MDADSLVWDSFWNGRSPESEIRMCDFYGLRPWVLKYTPRYGSVLEAGCGLGRYVFLLSCLGIDIEGLDFHKPTVEKVSKWGMKNDLKCRFNVGNVSNLPFKTNSLSGYLSFGVIEHFKEGPQIALSEAFRVLRPGGVAVISTPSPSIKQYLRPAFKALKNCLRRVSSKSIVKETFFQHWYSPAQLAAFIRQSGLRVQLAAPADVKYTFWEFGARPQGKMIAFRLADFLENKPLVSLGSQSITISVKVDDEMHCFLCGEEKTGREALNRYVVPVCTSCEKSKSSRYYRHGKKPSWHAPWIYEAENKPQIENTQPCFFCKQKVSTDKLFEDFGFTVPVCKKCLADNTNNLELSNHFLQPRWRPML